MVRRLLTLFMALALMMVALGGVEQVLVPETALGQGMGMQKTALDEGAGSVEDHHLDDLPSQAGADGSAADTLACAEPAPALPTAWAVADWGPRAALAGPASPYLDGLLRPPRLSA